MANKKIGLGGLGESLMTENAEGINALLDVNIRAEGSDDDSQSNGTALAGFVEMNIIMYLSIVRRRLASLL